MFKRNSCRSLEEEGVPDGGIRMLPPLTLHPTATKPGGETEMGQAAACLQSPCPVGPQPLFSALDAQAPECVLSALLHSSTARWRSP